MAYQPLDYNAQFNALNVSTQSYSIRHMNKLVDLTFNINKVIYIIIQGRPWFEGYDIALI